MSIDQVQTSPSISTQNTGQFDPGNFTVTLTTPNQELGSNFNLRPISVSIDSIQNSISNARPFASLPSPGDKNVEGIVSVGFIVDETLNNYVALHDLMHNNMVAENPVYMNLLVTYYSNHGNVVRKLNFFNCLITAVGGMELSYDASGQGPTITDVTLAYSHRLFS